MGPRPLHAAQQQGPSRRINGGAGIMKGRRLQATAENPRPVPELPGDYFGPFRGATGEKSCVWFLKPNARDPNAPPRARVVQHVVSPPHTFTEEPDGSLTITASIGDTSGPGSESDGYHCFLTKGEW